MKLYRGRLPDGPSPLMDQINRSLPFDIRLLPQDVAVNRAWAGELRRLGVFTDREWRDIGLALDEILAGYEAGAFDPLPDDEDVHTLVERSLTERLGKTGARIHTGRSRNDQVAADLRLYAVARLDELAAALRGCIRALRDQAAKHAETLLAGTTHLQPALPITLGHFLLSAAFALVRDGERVADARRRTNRSPLGSGAMAGSGFLVDRQALAAALGFESALANSVDAVSDRDFCLEIASACAIMTGHLSRYAEQLIIWANPAFGYVRFADAWSTGSSMMPQKRNPDAMELVRGKAARTIGAVGALMSMVKGVPLTYAKDLQEDKQPLFDALDTALVCVRVFAEAAASAEFFPERMARALSDDMLATDLADALARAGAPFRDAHERVGALVRELELDGRTLLQLGPADLAARFPELAEEPPALTFDASVRQRAVYGGAAPARVREQIAELDAYLDAGDGADS